MYIHSVRDNLCMYMLTCHMYLRKMENASFGFEVESQNVKGLDLLVWGFAWVWRSIGVY